MAAAAPASGRWLFGPVPDLLLGCGLFYVLLFAISPALGGMLRDSQAPYLFPLLVLLLSTPHYGATIVRVYEERASRRAYALFSLWATLLIFAAFVTSVHSRTVGAWMATIYLTWSPWHYTGQNYGLAVMFLRRRGAMPTPGAKRLLYVSFVLSYALVFLMMHASGQDAVDSPLVRAPQVVFLPLGIPDSVVALAAPSVLALYLLSLGAAATLLLRGARARDLAPAATLVLTQGLWFSLPFAARYLSLPMPFEAADWRYRSYYLSWIVAGHAIQYLWITTYYARASNAWTGYLPYFGKTLVAGLAIWTLPAVFFAPGALGSVGYAGGLGLLVAAAVNIHHFVLDGAIWKLRSSRIAGVLIRSERDEDSGHTPGWGRRLAWAVAGAAFAVGVFFFWEEDVAFPRAMARHHYAEAAAIQDRLAWFGRDTAIKRARVRKERKAYAARRAAEAERALSIHQATPSPERTTPSPTLRK